MKVCNRTRVLTALICFLLNGCTTFNGIQKTPDVTYTSIPWSRISLSSVDKIHFDCKTSIRKASRSAVSMQNWTPTCHKINACQENLKHCLEKYTHLIEVSTQENSLFTGYYHPIYAASTVKTDIFDTPILKKPADIIQAKLSVFPGELPPLTLMGRVQKGQFIPYKTRAEMATFNPDDVMAWMRSGDAFFLHVQGSGTLQFMDGDVKHLAYSGHNGHPYHAIGKTLISWGEIAKEDMSQQAIVNWLEKADKSQQRALLNQNPRYIFFTETQDEAVRGALGVPLIAEKSLAVDRRYIPLGSYVLMETTISSTDQPITALMHAADVGSAIIGAVRGDIYFGRGDAAQQRAGYQKAPGKLYIIQPKQSL